MNAAEEFSISHPEQFKLKALYRSAGEAYACCLDSNGYPGAFSSFDWLIGYGAQHILRPERNCLRSLGDFLTGTPGWKLGFLGYDLKNEVEQLDSGNPDHLGFPALCFFVPRELVLLKGQTAHILSESNPARVLQEIMDTPIPKGGFSAQLPDIRQRVSRERYLEIVHSIRQHIIAGDVYELNYCIDFYAASYECDPAGLFLRLNRQAPAPFASFLKMAQQYILCASPERFLKKTGNKLLSQPIKGTIGRSELPKEDNRLKEALRSSEKERAENVMIVDLVRNDLSRSAVPGSVRVSELFGIHTFPHWHQMISTVEAEAKPEIPLADIIRHAFPMGSMTGAPKIMAMKLIDAFEEVKRGAFSGAIGYFTPEGDFDLNVVIRSILYDQQKRYLSFPVGSAITFDSVPENEFEECLLKAKAIRDLLKSIP